MEKSTTMALKKENRKRIFRFIYQAKRTSKQEIADHLNLSLPTVAQNLSDLNQLGIIEKNGYFASTGGRKPNAILFCPESKIAIGLELLKDSFEMVAIDLYGTILYRQKQNLSFQNNDRYFETVCEALKQFASCHSFQNDQILGVGIVLQGLISSDGISVTYGKLLDCTGLSVLQFTSRLPYPCSMIHDAEAAATVELWNDANISDAIFFHIRGHLSGAVIIDGNFLKGRELKSGVFEHMTIVPNGEPCYCGKRGCMETCCSLSALLKQSETPDLFFNRLRAGDSNAQSRWNTYLEYLSTAIDNLHMFMDCDIILGGTLAQYLLPEDITALHHMVSKRTAFPTSRTFIQIAKSASQPIAKGAAIPYLSQFLEHAAE